MRIICRRIISVLLVLSLALSLCCLPSSAAGTKVYVKEATLKSQTDGTAPFDEGDIPGDDTGADNRRVRSFDQLSYTTSVIISAPEGADQGDGKLYFEFTLPVNEDKAVFNEEAMTWLDAKNATYYVWPVAEDNAQYLWGYFELKGSETDANFEVRLTLDVIVRVLAMTEGDTLQPTFEFWYGQEDRYSVTRQKVYPETVTITSAPRFNVVLVDGRQQNEGSFDFSTGNEKAFSTGAGTVQGRRTNYGIVLQIYGKDDAHGLRGCELPDGNDITFDLDISSSYYYNDASGEKEVPDCFNAGYAPLIWSFDQNKRTEGQQDGREISGVNFPYALNAPLNSTSVGGDGPFQQCNNGGTWSAALSEDRKKLSVTVSGYEINLNQLPSGTTTNTSGQWTYYNPDVVSGYWDVQKACFAAGELWIVQPFYNSGTGAYIGDEMAPGTFVLQVTASNLKMSGKGTELPASDTNENQMVTDDDLCRVGIGVDIGGYFDYDLAFRKTNKSDWDDALSDGCWENGKDWVAAGGVLSIFDWIVHRGTGDDVGVAYDQLIKFDSDYFTPETWLDEGYEWKGHWCNGGYAAVAPNNPDIGTPERGWNHRGYKVDEEGYDEAMKYATADDLIFFNSIWDLWNAGYVCVGVLYELRGCSNVEEFHSDRTVDGVATKDRSLSGNVFMVTHSASAWTKRDVKAAAAAYCGKDASELTDADYANYAQNAFPSRLTADNERQQIRYEGNYPAYPNNYNNQGVNGTAQSMNGKEEDRNESYKNYHKSVYDENGWVSGTAETDYGDSCLLISYAMEIEKTVTQRNGSSGKKTTYSMNDGQRVADYKLIGSANIGVKNLDETSSSLLETTVYIEDTLPKGLSYIEGSSYYGGTYVQKAEGQQGSVNGGTPINPTTVTVNADGTTTLLYTLENVELDLNKKTVLPAIYYSCKIGDTENLENDVYNTQSLENKARIWSAEDHQREFKTAYGNETTCAILISKLEKVDILKRADQVYADYDAPLGYTMSMANNTAEERTLLGMDILPYHGGNGTNFAQGTGCESLVTEMTLKVNSSAFSLASIEVYYTFDTAVREKTSADYYGAALSGWTKLTVNADGTVNIPSSPWKPTAIIIKGKVPSNVEIGIHLTLKLTNGTRGDVVVNKLYESDTAGTPLQVSAKSTLVTRSLSGLVWNDAGKDGIQNEGGAIPGVLVTLMKWSGSGYEPFENRTAVTDANGKYEFTHLPAGTYAVSFTDGSTRIAELSATTQNSGNDDTIDSDANAEKRIENIALPEQVGETNIYESKNNDCGLYSQITFVLNYDRQVDIPLKSFRDETPTVTFADTAVPATWSNTLMKKDAHDKDYVFTELVNQKIRMDPYDIIFAQKTKEYTSFFYKLSYDTSNGKVEIVTEVVARPADIIYYEESNDTMFTFTDGRFGEWKYYTDGYAHEDNGTTETNYDTTAEAQLQDYDTFTNDEDSLYTGKLYSGNTARMVNVSSEPKYPNATDMPWYPSVTFSFYGTGFDLISMGNPYGGILNVEIYEGTIEVGERPLYTRTCNTRYGVYFSETGEVEEEPVPTPRDRDKLYQGTMYSTSDLENHKLDYGQYTVIVEAMYSADFDPYNKGSFDLVIDGIRVINPLGLDENKLDYNQKSLHDIYAQEGSNPYLFVTQFDSTHPAEAEDNVTVERILNFYGPKFEVHLEPNQALAFTVNANAGDELRIAAHCFEGKGKAATLTVYEGEDTQGKDITVNSATLMHYDTHVTFTGEEQTIVLRNNSDQVIALTDFSYLSNKVVSIACNDKTASAAKGILLKAITTPEEPTPDTPEELKIKSASLSLSSDISINFYVADETLKGWDAPYMVFTKAKYDAAGNITGYENETVSSYTEKDGCHVYTFRGITAMEMSSAVTATLYATKNGVLSSSETVSYSVLTYATNQLQKSTDTKLHTLLVDLLNYGAAAQTYWHYNTANLANANLTEEQQKLATQTAPTLESCKALTKHDGAAVHFKSASLSLKEKVTINYYLDLTDYNGDVNDLQVVISYTDTDGSLKTATVDGSALSNRNGIYVASFSALNALQMRTACTAEVYDKTAGERVSDTVTYSIESYAASKADDTDAALAELVNAMMKYGDATCAYFSQQ